MKSILHFQCTIKALFHVPSSKAFTLTARSLHHFKHIYFYIPTTRFDKYYGRESVLLEVWITGLEFKVNYSIFFSIHGMKSGNLLKEFTGHTGFVNDVSFSLDGHHILSGSTDGTVRVWSTRTAECVSNFKVKTW